MKELQAKQRYVTKVRSLKTFGITFFECKQKLPGKKEGMFDEKKIKKPNLYLLLKATPYLIGITKSKVIKMDAETQKEIKSWTYDQLRRWSQNRGVFTFDFGDWHGDYLTLQTDEAEALSALHHEQLFFLFLQGSAIKCCQLLSQELGRKKFVSPQANLKPSEWEARMKDLQKHIIAKVDGEIFMAAKLRPGDLSRNNLDNRAKDITADLRNLAAATGALFDLDDSNSPLMDGCKALSDTVGDIFNMLTSVCESIFPFLFLLLSFLLLDCF